MEYYWELRSKNARNIKALMCPLYLQAGSGFLSVWLTAGFANFKP